MHRAEMLEEALTLAEHVGYRIRQEWLGGSGGGDCEINGQKWIFLDLALGTEDQLDAVIDTLRREPSAAVLPMHPELRELLQVRKIA